MKQSFVCFAPDGGAELKVSVSEMPAGHVAKEVDLRVHQRAQVREWFEGWWEDAFGFHAKRDHWALVDARLNGRPAPSGLNPDIVMWDWAARWLVGYGDQEWDDISLDT
jgi:hypothetical protein